MKSQAAFNKLYKNLNREQKAAVDTIEGPVMVIAGPGTGKTQILTLRIANILRKTDTPADAILALTFTESAAFSMRKRLVEIIGSAGYRVHISTFHSFCNDVIKKYPDEFPTIIGARHINDIDKLSILKDIILSSRLSRLKPFGNNFFYLDPIRMKISELKRENISPYELKSIVREQKRNFDKIPDLYYEEGMHKGKIRGKYQALEKKTERTKELSVVHGRYQDKLREDHLYDYDDMIVETIKMFESNDNLLLRVQEEYHYILADEHQDANNSQNRLLELLASFHENPNIFVVGDERQAIFRFQGASLENFHRFKKCYPEAQIISLEKNYRSSQAILDSAHSVIKNGAADASSRVPLSSVQDSRGERTELLAFSKPALEYQYIASEVKRKIALGVPDYEIAILYRTNRDADALAVELARSGIPYVIVSDQNLLTDPDIRKLVMLLRTIDSFGDDSLLLPVLHIDFLTIDNLDIYHLAHYARENKISLFSVMKSKARLRSSGVEDIEKLRNLYHKLSTWQTAFHNKSILSSIEMVGEESGFLSSLLRGENVAENLRKLRNFFDEINTLVESRPSYSLSDLISYFDLLEEHSMIIRRDSDTLSRGVRLMTAHKAKGLEFDYVFITDVHDGHWGNRRVIEHFYITSPKSTQSAFDEVDDERRLFYVALTRARCGVALCYAKSSEGGGRRLLSQFVEEIDPQFVQEIDVEKFEKKALKSPFSLSKKSLAVPLPDKEFLNRLFIEQGLSVTALNNYLSCPWNYFYNNLLRIPRAPSKHLMFGSAVHVALNELFNVLRVQEKMSKKEFLDAFERALRRQPLTELEFAESKTRGFVALAGYYNTYIKKWNKNVLTEFKVQVQLPVSLTELSSLRLRGDLDKIEFVGGSDVIVVDYKTGKPKTRNDIEGRTKNSYGNYKRQLVFYQLLLTLHDNATFKMVSGQIDFVEPDSRGRYHNETFIIEQKDVEELRELIKQSAHDILALSFWETYCDSVNCEYCRLREMMGSFSDRRLIKKSLPQQ